MTDQGVERRRWERVLLDQANYEAELRVPDAKHSAKVIDISGGGVSLSINAEILSEDPLGLSIVNFGNYDVAVVRQWDDGIAVEFYHDEDDQYSLQEELEAFRRENDYDSE